MQLQIIEERNIKKTRRERERKVDPFVVDIYLLILCEDRSEATFIIQQQWMINQSMLRLFSLYNGCMPLILGSICANLTE